jgi:hypothetical protein
MQDAAEGWARADLQNATGQPGRQAGESTASHKCLELEKADTIVAWNAVRRSCVGGVICPRKIARESLARTFPASGASFAYGRRAGHARSYETQCAVALASEILRSK